MLREREREIDGDSAKRKKAVELASTDVIRLQQCGSMA